MNDTDVEQLAAELKAAEATHRWGAPIKYAGSIADGPPPGVDHRGALVYECVLCGQVRVGEIPPELDAQYSDVNDPPTRSIPVGRYWDGLPCTGALGDVR